MIAEDYVSFETAKLLKEKGFNGECRDYYNTEGHFYSEDFKSDWNNGRGPLTIFSAPTLQMVMKWLREEKGVAVIPILSSVLDNEKFLWDIKIVVAETYDTYSQGWVYEKQEAACEAGIKYCLENLI